MQLLIDTTKSSTLIGITDTNRSVFEIQKRELVARHSESLLMHIGSIIERVGIKKSDIDSILCVTGPGSYTGSRVGVATCNALSFALHIPKIGLSKPEIVAKTKLDFTGLLAIPSYREHFWVHDFKDGAERMISQELLIKEKRPIVLLDAETSRGHDMRFSHEVYDYQNIAEVKKWAIGLEDALTEQDIVPYYFKAPTITR